MDLFMLSAAHRYTARPDELVRNGAAEPWCDSITVAVVNPLLAGVPAALDPVVDPAAVPHAAASSPAATGTPRFTGIGSRPSRDMFILILSCSGRWTLVRHVPPLRHLLAGTGYGRDAWRDWTVRVTCVTHASETARLRGGANRRAITKNLRHGPVALKIPIS